MVSKARRPYLRYLVAWFPLRDAQELPSLLGRRNRQPVVQLKNIRFDNPMFSLTTTFNREDFTRLLTTRFGIAPETVHEFFDVARGMNFYDDQRTTTRELFDRFFPGREDVVRLLMEPITYANGSTLEDPAITYESSFRTSWPKGSLSMKGGPMTWSPR